MASLKRLLRSGIIRASCHPWVGGLFRPVTNDLAAIFTLHRIHDPAHGIHGHTPEFLRTTLHYLKQEGYNFVSLEDVYRRLRGEIPPLRKAVVFTMDDGFIDQATIAAPIFAEFNCPLTIFLITGFLDRKLWPWDDQVSYVFSATKQRKFTIRIGSNNIPYETISTDQRVLNAKDFRNRVKLVTESEMLQALDDLSRNAEVIIPEEPIFPYLPMTWDMARKLEKDGVAFAPHTVSHPILSRLTPERVQYEISESWRRVREELSHPLPIFAYPTGRRIDFGIREIKILEEVGLSGATTMEPGHTDIAKHRNGRYARYQLNRYALPDNIEDVMQYCSWLEPAKMFFRMESLRRQVTEKFGGRRPTLRHYVSAAWDLVGGFWTYRKIKWSQVKRLVFVCKGNICRSPYAEMRARGCGIEVVSIGLAATSEALADPNAIKNAAVRGIDLEIHRSKRQDDICIEAGDLLIGMEPWHASALQRLAKKTGAQATLLGLWAYSPRPYIHDPYGHGEAYFQACFSVIDEAIEGLIKHMRSARDRVSPAEPRRNFL